MSPKPHGERSRLAQRLIRARDDVARRAQRARLDRVDGDGAFGIVVAWIAAAPIAWAIFIGVALPPLDSFGATSIVVGMAPAWIRIIIYLGAGAMVVAGTIASLARLGSRRVAGAAPAALVLILSVAAGGLAVVGLVARGQSAGAYWSAGCLAAGVVLASLVIVVAVVGRPVRNGISRAAASILLAAPFLFLAFGTSGPMEDPYVDPFWVTLSSILVSAVCVSAFYGFSTAGASRASRVRAHAARFRGLPAATVVAAGVVALLLLRFTVARTVFDDDGALGDAALWSLRSPESWPLAAAVGGLIVWLAFRSESAPLRESGLGWAVGALTAGGSYAFVATGILSVLFLGNVAFGWQIGGAAEFVSCGPYDCVATAGVLGVVAITPLLFLPRFRGTVGFAVALVGVPFVLAGTIAPLLIAAVPSLPTFWATPTEVVLAIVLACVVIVICQWCGRLTSLPVVVLIRLLVYPVVVVHAALLVPAVLGTGLAKPIAMGLVVLSVVLLLPPVSSDRRRQTAVVATASAAALFAALGLLTPARSEGWTALAQMSALLMLSIPVTVALVVRTRPRESAASGGRPDQRQRYSVSGRPTRP